MRRALALLTLALGLLAPRAGAEPRYVPAYSDLELGQYFIDVNSILRQGDVVFFRYKNVITWQYRQHLLQSARGKAKREKIKRWSYSLVSLYYKPLEGTARTASSATYSNVGKLLTRTNYDQPFTPTSKSRAVEAVCAAVMRHIAAHPEDVR